MTRIGVFSDSHGDIRALDELLEKMGYVDAVCFLGDVEQDAVRETALRKTLFLSARSLPPL